MFMDIWYACFKLKGVAAAHAMHVLFLSYSREKTNLPDGN